MSRRFSWKRRGKMLAYVPRLACSKFVLKLPADGLRVRDGRAGHGGTVARAPDKTCTRPWSSLVCFCSLFRCCSPRCNIEHSLMLQGTSLAEGSSSASNSSASVLRFFYRWFSSPLLPPPHALCAQFPLLCAVVLL